MMYSWYGREWPCAGYGRTRAQARAQRLSRRPLGHRGQQIEQQVKNALSSVLQTGCRGPPDDHGEDVRHSARVVAVVLDLLPGGTRRTFERKRKEQDADEQLDTSEPAHRSRARMSGSAHCAQRRGSLASPGAAGTKERWKRLAGEARRATAPFAGRKIFFCTPPPALTGSSSIPV